MKRKRQRKIAETLSMEVLIHEVRRRGGLVIGDGPKRNAETPNAGATAQRHDPLE